MTIPKRYEMSRQRVSTEASKLGTWGISPLPRLVGADGLGDGLHRLSRKGFPQKNVREGDLDPWRNASRHPVLDALHAAASLVEAKKLSDLCRAAERSDKRFVIHDPLLNVTFNELSNASYKTRC